MRSLLLLLALTGCAHAVELIGPASVESGSGTLVRVTADGAGADCLWAIKPATLDTVAIRNESGAQIGVAFAAPSASSGIKLVEVECIDWEARAKDELAVVVTGAVEPDPPAPPEDKLDPASTWVVVLFEADEQNAADATRSPRFDDFLGRTFQRRWRLWDDDILPDVWAISEADDELKQLYLQGQGAKPNDVPWVVMSDGTTTVSKELPGGTDEAIAAIKEELE